MSKEAIDKAASLANISSAQLRIALESLRNEVTQDMRDAGWSASNEKVDFWDYGGWTGAGYTLESDVADECWKAMFDALLKPPVKLKREKR